MKNAKYFLCLGAFVLLFSSCDKQVVSKKSSAEWGNLVSSPSQAEKIERQKFWNTKKPSHYRYKLKVRCPCRLYTNGSIDQKLVIAELDWLVLEIKNEHIISVKSIDGTAIPGYAVQVDYKNPIESVFDLIGKQTELGFEKLFVIYDKEMGFPRFYQNTGEKGPTDIAIRLEIIEFENLDE